MDCFNRLGYDIEINVKRTKSTQGSLVLNAV